MTAMRRASLLVLSALALLGCSSDAVDPPEPTLQTVGAFVAQEEDSGQIRLLRTTQAYKLENGQTVLIFYLYEPRASSFDAARELAKRHGLRIENAGEYALESELVQTNYRIVWFRTLTADEQQ